MNDLISREQAIKLLNLNKPNVDEKTKYAMWQFDKDLQTIKTMPSAERTGKWIPVSERLPEEPYGCLVTVWDTNPITWDDFENILPYFVGWDGEQWNNSEGEQCPFEVIAWMSSPKPYKEV